MYRRDFGDWDTPGLGSKIFDTSLAKGEHKGCPAAKQILAVPYMVTYHLSPGRDTHGSITPKSRKNIWTLLFTGVCHSPIFDGHQDRAWLSTASKIYPSNAVNYKDRSYLIVTFHVADDTETMDCIIDKVPGFMERYLPEFAESRGFLTTNANDAESKLPPTPEELKQMGPAFQEVWKRHYEKAAVKPALIQTVFNGHLGPRSTVPDGKCFMIIGNIQGYPVSRGHVYITSPNPYARPDFETDFLHEQADANVLVWAYKKCPEVVRRTPSFRSEHAELHPKLPEGSGAAYRRGQNQL
ncbi:hypothetical protein FRC10_007126 [Ceratobasidium sp. 414]|nr:hypothetical protein FRC10_007126 [Ceratobasidium sp. 414]